MTAKLERERAKHFCILYEVLAVQKFEMGEAIFSPLAILSYTGKQVGCMIQ